MANVKSNSKHLSTLRKAPLAIKEIEKKDWEKLCDYENKKHSKYIYSIMIIFLAFLFFCFTITAITKPAECVSDKRTKYSTNSGFANSIIISPKTDSCKNSSYNSTKNY